jgi:hypothetical protein
MLNVESINLRPLEGFPFSSVISHQKPVLSLEPLVPTVSISQFIFILFDEESKLILVLVMVFGRVPGIIVLAEALDFSVTKDQYNPLA